MGAVGGAPTEGGRDRKARMDNHEGLECQAPTPRILSPRLKSPIYSFIQHQACSAPLSLGEPALCLSALWVTWTENRAV